MSRGPHPDPGARAGRRTRPTAEATAQSAFEEEFPEASARPMIVVLLAVIFGVGALLHGLSAARMWGFAVSENAQIYALLSTVLALSSLAASIGLWRVRASGWWSGVLVASVSVLLHTRLVAAPLAALNWDHPRAGSALMMLALVHGLPLLIGLVLAVLLALPRVRLAVGVKERPLERRRRHVAAGASKRRAD